MPDKNYHTIRYGNRNGEIQFGHLHGDGVLSAVMLRSGHEPNGLHYISMEADGNDHRKHGTIARSTGSFQVEAGDNVQSGKPGIFLDAVSGDIVIRASSGNVRIEGINVTVKTTGSDNKNGNIILDANDKIIGKAQSIDLNSKISTKIFSEKTVDCIGKAVLNIYGGMVDCADGATEVIGSKGTPSSNEQKNKAIL